MRKTSLKIVKLYLISFICVICYFILENSSFLTNLVIKSNKLRYNGFVTFLLTGLFKYGLLIVGLGSIFILTFILLRKK
jgi:hypothetical protein